jgi:hypothetical protein
VDAVVDWAPLLVPEPELAEEIIETLSLGAMHLTAFLLDDDVGTDDVSLLLAETHAGDPTAAKASNQNITRWGTQRGANKWYYLGVAAATLE